VSWDERKGIRMHGHVRAFGLNGDRTDKQASWKLHGLKAQMTTKMTRISTTRRKH